MSRSKEVYVRRTKINGIRICNWMPIAYPGMTIREFVETNFPDADINKVCVNRLDKEREVDLHHVLVAENAYDITERA